MPLTSPALIDSPRLTVRLVTEADLPALLAVNGDPGVTRFLPYATWTTLPDAETWYRRMMEMQDTGSALQFVVALKPAGTAIGTCLLFRHDEGSARAELGYVLGSAHQGAGYMHEALTALINAAFGSMGLRRLEAEVDPRNTASVQLLKRLGFVREGLLREKWLTGGKANDVEIHGLLSREWPGATLRPA